MGSTQINDMYYGASPQTFQKAKLLRLSMTEPEQILWRRIKSNQLKTRFKRQHPIGPFIADFYCHKHKLVVEIDGGYHTQEEQKEYDKARTEIINQYNIRVLRFSNEEVYADLDKVINEIKQVLKLPTLPPTP